MIKKFLFIILGIIYMTACGEKPAYRIEGKLENLKDETVYVVFEKDDITRIDTLTCEKPGQFSVERKEGDFNSITLFFENKTTWITVYPERGEKITITGDMNYPSLLQVKGGKINNELTAVRKRMGDLLKEHRDLTAQLKNTGNLDTLDENELNSRLTNVNHQIIEQVGRYIQDNPDQKASVILMQTFFADPDDTRKLDEYLALLDPALKNYYLVRELEQFSERAKRTALGAEAPGFSVKNVYGETVSLDSFPEKYLLLTFTAPWCDMCQTETLHLDEIVHKYPKEQLDMVVVSLDDDLKGVREVLAKDSIQWNLVTDSAGQAAMLLDLYNVSALPWSYLIDEEGKIILKTENGIEIKQTLEKILD
ncbi:MAG: AhpC/TSA family protein [Tannerellaceae bacterium]|nr:AhpC/TSA family protein [Tannerellaceae bacterium]